MLTNEEYTIRVGGEVLRTRIRTWGHLHNNYMKYRNAGPISLVPVEHEMDSTAIRVDIGDVPVGYLPNPDRRGVKAKVRAAMDANMKAIMEVARDIRPGVQLDLFPEEE